MVFFDLFVDFLDVGVMKIKVYYKEILVKLFDFFKEEVVEMDSEKCKFVKNDKELKDFWCRSFKYEILICYVRVLKD